MRGITKMEYHIIKRFKYTSGDSTFSHVRTEKSLEKAIEKRLYLEKLEDSENISFNIVINIDNVFDYINTREGKKADEKPLVLTEEVA
tara:strand:+ start:250 stop:513 length:264 start_codon:yes stop_codon:yes gene_type:complete